MAEPIVDSWKGLRIFWVAVPSARPLRNLNNSPELNLPAESSGESSIGRVARITCNSLAALAMPVPGFEGILALPGVRE